MPLLASLVHLPSTRIGLLPTITMWMHISGVTSAFTICPGSSYDKSTMCHQGPFILHMGNTPTGLSGSQNHVLSDLDIPWYDIQEKPFGELEVQVADTMEHLE